MKRQRKELKKTPIYRMEFFGDGDLYYSDADLKRFQTIENQLDSLLRITGGGILKGWEVFQDSNSLDITISPGIGIIPFVQDKIDPVTREKIFDEDSGEVIKDTYYLSIRTKSQITIPNAVGLNRRSVVFVGLSPESVEKIQSQNIQGTVSEGELVDWDDFTELTISPSVENSELPGRSGPYRNTTASPNDIEYPIKNYIIDGDFNPNTQKIVSFVNGKPYYEGFSINGKTIIFDNPLHKEDVVTVRIEPKYGLALADIESDGSEIIKIDNSIRISAFTKSADSLIYSSLIGHKHSNLNSNPQKILLTTETGLISSVSSINNKIYIFDKKIENKSLSEFYGFDFNSGTYDIDVYVNGFLSTDSFEIIDNGSSINIEFEESLGEQDSVQIVLYIKNLYTQIKNKLIISRNNPSEDNIDISLSGESIDSGTLSKDVIPRLSHIGISNEIMKPSNPSDGSEEFVHYSESIDSNFLKEFFPVYKEKSNARNSFDMFSEPKVLPGEGVSSPSKQIIHVCCSGGLFYKEVPFSDNQKTSETRKGFIMGSKIGNYFDGWKNINFDLGNSLKEFDAPFSIIPIKIANSPSSNNWDLIFVISEKFIYAISWSNLGITNSSDPSPRVLQVLNTTGDVPSDISKNNPYYSKVDEITSIVSATMGRGILNLEKTVYILAENGKVYCFDYIENKYTWVDITSDIIWSNDVSNIFSLTYDKENLLNDMLFVGDGNDLYFNSIGKKRFINSISSGLNQISSVVFEPSEVWDGSINKLVENGDNLIFFGNRFEEKVGVSLIQYSSSSPFSAQISLENSLTKTFPGKQGEFYRSGFIKDWEKHSKTFNGTPNKILFENERIFISTNLNVYVSDNTFSDINEVNYNFLSSTFSEIFSSTKNINDIKILNNNLVVSCDDGIYTHEFEYSSIPVSFSRSENTQYATSINNILYPSKKLIVDDTISSTNNVIFSLGKYGIFQSTDSGNSWRNTIQLLGQPEDKNFNFNKPKSYLKVIGIDSTKNRVYVVKESGTYGYGYGYGYGSELNYFDVFNFNSFNTGYGIDGFEDIASYDYGYGFEISNAIQNINTGDWIYFPKGAGTSYETNPLRILGVGVEGERNYVDIEQGDGYPADFSLIPFDLNLEVFSRIEPVPLIDGIPQNSVYETANLELYEFDPFRQSVEFYENQNLDNIITIASKYKSFELIENFDLSLTENLNPIIKLSGIDLSDYWTKDGSIFNFLNSFNIDDVLRLTIKNSHITDTGIYTHKEIEDKFSLETTGLTYELDGIRTGNFMQMLMQIKHKIKDYSEFSNTTEVEINVSSFGSAVGTENPWIEDNSTVYSPGAFVGRFIEFDRNGKSYKFTISSNTMHRFFIQRKYSYEYFSLDGNTSTLFLRKGSGVLGTFKVFKQGLELSSSDFVQNIEDGEVVSITINSGISENDNVFIKYVNTEENFDISTLFDIGQKITIPAIEDSITSRMTNVFVSNYRDNNFIIDLDRSFIENEIISENSNLGDIDYTLFHIYSNDSTEKFYAGTDEDVWSRDFNSIVFSKTGKILETINPTGDLSLSNDIDGAYIEYNSSTEEWKVTWGGNSVLNDLNLDLSKIKCNSVVIVDENVSYAGTDRGFYRTLSGSSDWEYVWNTIVDSRTSSSPEIISIEVDDKHPWIVNAVFDRKIYRSYDFGNNWIKLSENNASGFTEFSYQKDNSDSRSLYYYGSNSIFFKEMSKPNEFISNNIKEIKTDLCFGTNFISSNFSKIKNNPNDIDEVYFALNSLGIYKTQMLGGSRNISRKVVNNNYGVPGNSISFSSIGIEKTGALHDSYSSNIFYSLYVSPNQTESSKIFLQMNVDPSVAKVLKDHEFAGYFAKLPDGNYYKIIDNYDRGPVYEFNYFKNSKNENLDFRRIEFVLEGTYKYDTSIDGLTIDNSTGDYWYNTSNPFGNLQNTISISFLKESNGEDSKIRLSDFEVNCYAVKSEIWTSDNTNESETVLILDYSTLASIPSNYTTEDALKGYFVGNPNNGLLYEIYNSKVLTSSDQYYDNESASARGHLALRIEKKSDSNSDNWSTLYRTEDPFYLWHKYFGLELHNNWRSVLVDPSSVNPSPDFYNNFNYSFTNYNTEKIFSSKLEGTTFVVFDDLFESGKNQACVVLSYEDETSTAYETDNDLRDFIIKDPSTNYSYTIVSSKKLTSGDNYYDSNYHRVQCRLERYDGSYDSNIVLYSDGSFDDIQSDRVRLTNRLGMSSDTLIGSSIYFENRPFLSYRIKEISGDYIVVDSNKLNSIAYSGEKLKLKSEISERTSIDMSIDGISGEVFAVSNDFLYRDNSTKGKRWFKIYNGLEINSNTNIPYAKFVSCKHDDVGNYLYAISPTETYGGLYIHDTSTFNVNIQKISNSSDLISGEKLISLDVYRGNSFITIFVGTEDNGIFKGVSSTLNPSSSTWTWEKINFPENNISSVDAITEQDSDDDIDRIWVGTEGAGVYKRDEESNGNLDSTWLGNIESIISSEDINSSEWRVWRVEKNSYNTKPLIITEEGSSIYINTSSPGVSDQSVFDWSLNRIYDKNLGLLYYSIDASNANYITDSFENFGNVGFNTNKFISEDSRVNHKFHSVCTSSVTNNEIEKQRSDKGNFVIDPNTKNFFKFDFIFNFLKGESIYEEPFRHTPDKGSIVKILNYSSFSNSGFIVFTERDGIYRCDNTKKQLLPSSLQDYSDFNTYGFDFSENQFNSLEDQLIEYPGYRYTNEGGSTEFNNNIKFNRLYEKLFMFNVDSVLQSTAYSDITSYISSYGSEALVGSYLIVSKGVDETNGPEEPVSFVVRSIELQGTTYKIQLSIGRLNVESIGNSSILEDAEIPTSRDIGNKWENGFDWTDYTKYFFLDSQSFTKINSGLPNNFKEIDTDGNTKLSIQIRDAVKASVLGPFYIACGSNGIYVCNDISISNPTWSLLSGSEDINSISLSYDFNLPAKLYVGTPNEGVWKYSVAGSTWELLTGLDKHPHVWSLFFLQGDGLYAGTEHGGIYKLSGSEFSQLTGPIRSKIFSWKTEGVPVKREDSSFDYSNNSNLLSYSYGGGIMVSRDRGVSWEQSNDGLKNLYVQDVAICSNSSNLETAYAATCGGGLYKTTNAFSSSGGKTTLEWSLCSTEGLPRTLNIDEVAVGTDPDIVYIKCRVNDFSIKSHPYRKRPYLTRSPILNSDDIGFVDFVEYQDIFRIYNDFENLVDQTSGNMRYTPYYPYVLGSRKHVVYRSSDGGNTWSAVYDIELTSSDFSSDVLNAENVIFGLEMPPGESDTVKFVSNYSIEYRRDSEIYSINKMAYTTISYDSNENLTFSEKEIPAAEFRLLGYEDLGMSTKFLSSDGYISIDPNNTNIVFFSVGYYDAFSNKKVPILYSEDDGTSWERRISIAGDNTTAGFNTGVQISTKNNDGETISFSTSYLSSNSGYIQILGEYEKRGFGQESFYWDSIRDEARTDSKFVNINFNNLENSEYNKNLFIDENNIPRPFNLKDAILIPDVTNNGSSEYTIVSSGYGEYYHRKTSNDTASQKTTFKLNSEFNATSLNVGEKTTSTLKNITSFKIPFSEVSSNSILGVENLFVNCLITFNSISYRIAFHRVYDDNSLGLKYVEFILIGDASDDLSGDFEISIERKIYSNYNNKIYVSVNSGISWAEVNSEFDLSNFKIIDIEDIPGQFIGNSFNRVFFAAFKVGNAYKLRVGKTNDNRYSGGEKEEIDWEDISITFLNSILENGLKFVNEGDNQYLYITSKDSIYKKQISNTSSDFLTGEWILVRGDSQIEYPLEISSENNLRMAYIADGRIFVSLDAFASEPSSYSGEQLPVGSSSGYTFSRLLIDPSGENENEILLSIENDPSPISISANILSLNVSDDVNEIVVSNSGAFGSNPFLPTGVWEDKPVIFKNNLTTLSYISKIQQSQNNLLLLYPTLRFLLSSYEYNSFTNETKIFGSIESEIETFDVKDYLGSIFVIYDNIEDFITGQISKINYVNDQVILTISGNVSNEFEDKNFDSEEIRLRIGSLKDILGFEGIVSQSNFGKYSVSSSRVDDNIKNGLYISSAFGRDWTQVSISSNKESCIDFEVNENNSITAIVNIDNSTRAFINDLWLPSENIKKVITDDSGNLYFITDNGYSKSTLDLEFLENSIFENKSFINFKDFIIDNNDLILIDENDRVYVNEKDDFKFDGRQIFISSNNSIKDISKIIKDSNGVLWVITESEGLKAFVGSNSYTFGTLELGTNTIFNIFEDNLNRIWVALGENGVAVINYFLENNAITNYNIDLFTEKDGFRGSVKAISQKNGLNFVSQGNSEIPSVLLTWSNNSTTYSNVLISRSRNQTRPVYEDIIYSFNQISGQIFSIEEDIINLGSGDIAAWKITAQNFSSTSGQTIETNSFVGKHILLNSRENDLSRIIIANTVDLIYIEKEDEESAPTENGKYFMVAEKIEEDAYVIFTGNSDLISFTLTDSNIVSPGTYYYYLDFYDSEGNRVAVDSEEVLVSNTAQNYKNSSEIILATDQGVWGLSYGDIPFSIRNQFDESENITDIFVDTLNVIYISAGSVLIQLSDDNRIDLGKSDLFGDNISFVSSKTMEVRNIVEGSSQEIVIATNIGLSIKRSDNTFFSFVENDDSIVYRKNNLFNIKNWRPVKNFESKVNSVGFVSTNTGSRKLYISSNSIWETSNNGKNWLERNRQPEEIKGIEEIHDSSGNIIDYIIYTKDIISSTSSGDIETNFNIFNEKEYIDIFTTSERENIKGSPAHIYLSESSSSSEKPIIFAGVFDNRILSTEIEIIKLSLASQDDLNQDPTSSTLTELGAADGLGIQSIYCFNIDDLGNIYAGGKDNICFSTDSGATWNIYEFVEDNDSETSLEHVYTSLEIRDDATALETERVFYVTRTPLYGRKDNNFLILRISENDLEKNITEVSIENSFIDGIEWVDRPGHSTYSWESRNHFGLAGHRGCTYFDFNTGMLYLGGFENKLFCIPFLLDRDDSIKRFKKRVSFSSGKRYREYNQLQIISQFDTWSQIDSSGRIDLYDKKFMPRSSWGISFIENSNGEEEGYMSGFIFGQNQNYYKTFYEHTPSSDSAFIYKSYMSDMMFWEPFLKDNQPDGIISDFKYYDGELYATSIYGNWFNNIGLFKLDNSNGWEKQDRSLSGDSSQYFNVPINELTIQGDELIIPTLGFGIHKNTGSYETLSSRFFTQYGIEYGRWDVVKIAQDPNNKNRILVATTNRGIIEGEYSLEENIWKWSSDQFGFKSGNITEIVIPSVNTGVVLAGVSEDGLYRKNPETKIYSKITEGIPSLGSVIKLKVNNFVIRVESSVPIEELGDNIIILRSSYENPKRDPVDGTSYFVNDEIFNSQVIYSGNDSFSDNIYIDNDVTLKSGVPYFYRIYKVNSGNIYEERDLITGKTRDISTLSIETTGNTFASKDLTGRIAVVNSVATRPVSFEIIGNSYNSTTNRSTVLFKSDIYRVINQGNADLFDRGDVLYRIESTILRNPIKIQPIWMIYKENGSLYSKVYVSNDNGVEWSEKTSGLPSSIDIYDIEITKTNETRNFIKHVIYLATSDGIYYSTNDGTSWSKIVASTLPEISYSSIISDKNDYKILYAISSDGKIYRTIDFASNWILVKDFEKSLNNYDLVSKFSNSIFLGFDSIGLKEFYDPIREEFIIQIDSDGKITNVQFEEFESGDEIFTDSNTIIAKTYPRNDDSSGGREVIRFKVNDETKYLTFRLNKKEKSFKLNEIRIGDSLENPLSVPFLLQNPNYDSGYIRINKIGALGDEDFVISNKGIHITSNNGLTWRKLTSSFLPNDIKDLALAHDSSILLATSSGLWSSDILRKNFRNIEQKDSNINVLWESFDSGVRRLFRAGENGLYITVEKPLSRTIITYSGDISEEKNIKFSWGDLVSPRDGGWTEKTEEILQQPLYSKPSSSQPLQEYKGWDAGLIVRYGPFTTFEKAESYANSNLWLPVNGAEYPNAFDEPEGGFSFEQSAVFRNADEGLLLEESSNQREFSGFENITTYHTNGVIFIGDFPNVNEPNSYPESNNYPRTDFPIIDNVDANIGEIRRIESDGSLNLTSTGYLENFSDIRAYEDLIDGGDSMSNSELLDAIRSDSEAKKKLAPILKSNMYYAYRIFPYRLVPDPTEISSNGTFIPTPRYRVPTGDLVESFSYIVDIEKFTGAKNIISGTSTLSGNWIVGTDSGLFYSTQNGQNVVKSENLSSNLSGYKFVTVLYTSENVVLAVAVNSSSNDIRFVKNSSDFTNINFDSNWEFLNDLSSFFKNSGANIVFNLEESEGFVYASTNKGLFKGDSSGENWSFIGRIGNLESNTNGKIIGQEFEIE